MKLLMHICCANCALYPLKTLKERGITYHGLWFNPNIHPYREYRKRLDTLKELQSLWKFDITYKDHYGLTEFVRAVVYDEKNRCSFCYRVRLKEAARLAKKLGMDAFSTTLLVSPYQKIELLKEIGTQIQDEEDVEFFFQDFRDGFREGMALSKELGFYRQNYCGCIFSEMERFLKKKDVTP